MGPRTVRLTMGYALAPAWTLGAFQRRSDVPGATLQRVSGGGGVRVGPGTLWLQLGLELGSLPAEKLLNRQVRPLLKALTRVTSVPATYFGRDWVAMAHRPVAFVGFAHSAEQGTAVFEAVVAVDTPFADARASFRDRSPGTLAELKTGSEPVDREVLMDAIEDAYRVETVREVPTAAEAPDEPAWAATMDEAIGTIAAGPDHAGRMRVGGEFMASSDAVAMLEAALAAGADLDAAIDDAFTRNGATIFGVRSLKSLRDVLLAARR